MVLRTLDIAMGVFSHVEEILGYEIDNPEKNLPVDNSQRLEYCLRVFRMANSSEPCGFPHTR